MTWCKTKEYEVLAIQRPIESFLIRIRRVNSISRDIQIYIARCCYTDETWLSHVGDTEDYQAEQLGLITCGKFSEKMG